MMGLLSLLCVAAAPVEPVDPFHYVLGTQIFGARYQFTDQPMLLEAAEAMRAMGANVIKFGLGDGYHSQWRNVAEADPNVTSLVDLARNEPTHRRVLDLPFGHFVLWVYPFSDGWWADGYTAEESERQSRELYDLVCHLLRTYSGTGKTFYLGHWEGDWHLRRDYRTDSDDETVVPPTAVPGMIAWLNARQEAIEAAKRDTPHHDVTVWGYVEVNLVKLALDDRTTVTNDVLPHTRVDYVSYSCYDTQADPELVTRALDHIAAKLPDKPGVPGRRVFLGEYGFPAQHHTPAEQDRLSRRVMRTALAWGCPFALYWELYNNEVTPEGRQRGFWLIDDQGAKQPVYQTHAAFLNWARGFVTQHRRQHGTAPDPAAFRAAAVAWLDAFSP